MQRAAENAGDGKVKLHQFRSRQGRLHRARCGARSPTAARWRPPSSQQRRRAPRSVVGLERRQARARMVVLRRHRDDRHAARQFRAGVRPHRTGAAARRSPSADAVGGGGSARAAAAVGARPRRRHGARTCATIFAWGSPTPGRVLPSWSRRATCWRSRSKAGASPPISIRRHAIRAASRPAPCWRRSIR